MGKYRERSCGSRHCCGSGEIQIALLREQILLRQWGNTDSAPAGAGTAAAVGKPLVGIPVVAWGCWEREWAVVGGLGDGREREFG